MATGFSYRCAYCGHKEVFVFDRRCLFRWITTVIVPINTQQA